MRPTDFSGVIDVDNKAQLDTQPEDAAITAHPLPHPAGQLYLFRRHPGFLLLRGALDKSLQHKLIVDCLTVFPDAPATTNLTRDNGLLTGLWQAAQQGLSLSSTSSPPDVSPDEQSKVQKATEEQSYWVASNGKISAQKLLQKLRWASIGPPFDWTKREYIYDCPRQQIPQYLVELSTSLTDAALSVWQAAEPTSEAATSASSAALSLDAALVNFYHDGDTLGGHLDDAERDMRHPIVSISLGAPGILLIGGPTRDETPTPLWLRSGDVVIFAGPARKCYHGLPRILSDWEGGNLDTDGMEPEMAAFMKGCRLNVSVRGTA